MPILRAVLCGIFGHSPRGTWSAAQHPPPSTLCGTDSAHHQAEAEKRKKYEASLLQAEEAKRTGQTRRPVGLGAGERVGTAPDLLEVQCPRLILRLCAASTSASMVVTISIFPHRSSLLARRRIRRGAWHVGATELLHEAAGDPALREVFRLFQPAVEVGHVVHIDPLPCLIADVINQSISSCTFLLTGRMSSDSEGR